MDDGSETSTIDDGHRNRDSAPEPAGSDDSQNTTHATEQADTDQADYSTEEDRLALYEWLGGISAGLGIFLTPLLSGPFAFYCALQIRDRKPVTALLIVAIVFVTAVFWLVVFLFIFPS
jgi:hypothetical protein